MDGDYTGDAQSCILKCYMAFHTTWQYEPYPIQDHLHVRLLALDLVRLDGRWQGEGVRSSYWRLYINAAPGAMVAVAGQTYALLPGQVHLIPAWIPFDCWTTTPLDHFFIHFDLVGWPPALIRDVFGRPLALPLSRGTQALFERLVEVLRQRGHDPPEILGLAKALVYLSIAEIIPADDARTTRWDLLLRGPSLVSNAIGHVERQLPREIDNATLAHLCHMSKSHFIRTFRQTVGQTPAQYVRERRVARAAEQLALTRATIEQVTADCGFPNRFYFTRAFTHVMGVTPARYRAMNI